MSKNKTTTINDDDLDNLSAIDYSENIADAQAPDPLPEREYVATITEVTAKESQKGNKYLAVQFKINPEDYPADYDAANAPDGTTLTYSRIVIDDTIVGRHRMRRFCESIGSPMSKRIVFKEWIGLTAKVTIKHDEYEGVNRATIAKVEAA